MTLAPKGEEKSTIKAVDILLVLPKEVIESAYMENGRPNATGTKLLTQLFIQGLSANIHSAHQTGQRDSAEHLRYIIAELERGFVWQVNAEPSEWKG